MVTISDTLTYIDGSKANGRLVVSWKPFTVGNTNVAGGEMEWAIVDGVVSVTLYSNTAALPSGSYYIAKYEMENGAVYSEQWVVPNLGTVNLGQVRVSFPPSPSIMISPLQLTSLQAAPGMFLMWDGTRWVPGFPSTFNLNPNWVNIQVAANGADVNMAGMPLVLGNTATLNVPSAGPAARGVVTTGAQSFSGVKTFSPLLKVIGDVDITGAYRINGVIFSGVVSSVFGRTGAVVAQAGDYVVAQVTGAVPDTRGIAAGAGLEGGGNLSADRAFSVVPDTTVQRIRYTYDGIPVGVRPEINLVPGANVSINVTDDPVHNRINVAVAAAGGSSGMADPTTIPGDLIVRGSVAPVRLGVGSNSQVLTSDSAAPLGVKWAAPAGSVASVFTRTGAVVAAAGDYTAAQVTNAVSTLGSYADPAWITTLAWGKITGVPAGVGQTPWQTDIDGNGKTLFNAGKIGIGTASPQLPLDVSGAIRATGTTNSASGTGVEIHYNPGQSFGALIAYDRGASAVKPMHVGGDGGTIGIRITSTGNVGIGTISPASVLHVFKTQNNAITAITIDNNGAGTGVGAGVRFAYGPSIPAMGGIYHDYGGTDWYLRLKVYNNSAEVERLTINGASGNVGIGISNPLSALSVIAAANPTTVATANQITIGETTNNPDYRLSLGFCQGSPYRGVIQSTNAGPALGQLLLQPLGGNVGIGTASPVAGLHVFAVNNVDSNVTFNGPASFVFDNAGVQLAMGTALAGPYGFWMQSRLNNNSGHVLALNPKGGNVGIGIAGPSSKLHIHDGDVQVSTAVDTSRGFLVTPDGVNKRAYLFTSGNNAGHSGYLELRNGVGNATTANIAMYDAAGTLVNLIGTAGNTYFNSGGNVGIGTGVPQYPLSFSTAFGDKLSLYPSQVWGLGLQSGLLQVITSAQSGDTAFGWGTSAAFTEVMRVKGTGNVGIGAITPVARLHVVGSSSTPSIIADTEAVFFAFSSSIGLAFGSYPGSPYAAWIQTKRTTNNFNDPLVLNPLGGNVGIGTSNPLGTLTLSGNVPAPGSNYTPYASVGGSLLLDDINTVGGSGGQIVFSAGGGAWQMAAIKAAATNGGGNSQGDLVFYTRRLATDAAFTQAMRINQAGDCDISGTYKVNGVPLATGGGGGVTAQSSGLAGNGRVLSQVYQNTDSTPRFVTVCCSCPVAGSFWADCNSANSFNTGTRVAQTTNQGVGGTVLFISFWVLPSYWYLVSISGSLTLTHWTEWH